jgi:glutathione synthase/RimK-type ligase-like ATP-grasp enzyme
MGQYKILILTNPWHKYTKLDPTPTLIDLLLKRDHQVFLTHLSSWVLGTAQISIESQQIHKINLKTLQLKLSPTQNKTVTEFDGLVNYYFDYGYTENYHHFLVKLSQFENKLKIFNAPTATMTFSEKTLPQALNHFLPFSQLCFSEHSLQKIIKNWQKEDLILKPLGGYGGNSVHCLDINKPRNVEKVFRALNQNGKPVLVQEKIIRTSQQREKRMIFSYGKYLGQYSKIPAPGDFRGNICQGGKVEPSQVESYELPLINHLENWGPLRKLWISGIDTLATKIIEINPMTAVAGIAQICECRQPLIDNIEKSIAEFQSVEMGFTQKILQRF